MNALIASMQIGVTHNSYKNNTVHWIEDISRKEKKCRARKEKQNK